MIEVRVCNCGLRALGASEPLTWLFRSSLRLTVIKWESCYLVTSQREISQIALILQGIPHSGYILPEAMVCCLSVFRLTRLEGQTLPGF
jgi:hypothetical protein